MAEAAGKDTPSNCVWVPLGDYIALAGEQLVRDGLNNGSPCRYRDAFGNLRSGNNLPGGFWLECAINREEHSARRRERTVPADRREAVLKEFAARFKPTWPPAPPEPEKPSASEYTIPAIEIFCVEVLAPRAEEKSVTEPTAQPEKIRRGGRPTSAPLILAEAERRLQTSDIPRGLKDFEKQLSDWLRDNHPEARRMEPKTVGDHLRKCERVRALLPLAWRRRS
jgi:hypothetical protein